MNFDVLKEKISSAEIVSIENSFDKVRVASKDLVETLNLLKNNPEYDFSMLNTIIAVDLNPNFELIYDLYSVHSNKSAKVSVIVDLNSSKCPSVVEVFKSAYFDECEIYDLFGVEFTNNPNLKRLFMPKGWVGHPLRKDYVLDDKRLSWNEEKVAR